MHIRSLLVFVLTLMFSWLPCFSASGSDSIGSVHLMFPSQTVCPGDEIEGIVKLTLQPGWHTYWKNPGDAGLAPAFDWELPHGVTVKEVIWPAPSLIKQADAVVYGYEGSPEWIVRLLFDKDMIPETQKVVLTAFFLACDGMCTPVTSQAEFSFTVSPSAPKNINWKLEDKVTSQFPTPLLVEKAILRNDSLSLTLPVTREIVSRTQNFILFPESSKIVPSNTKITWTKEDNGVTLNVPLLPEAAEELREIKQFSGLVQLDLKDTTTTYAVNVPIEYTLEQTPPPHPKPKLWKEKDVSMEKIFSSLPASLSVILLAAFLGGIILNITPCVLPVVGIKMLHLLSFKGKGKVFLHGLSFTLGVLAAFWALAGVLYSLGHVGQTIGWGFQLQQPFFVSALILILFLFSLSLFGLFEFGTSIASFAGEVESSLIKTPSYFSSFISGLFATVIATPCTGPLLGSVLGFAATFEPKEGFYLFTAMGFGMAFPFLLVTIFPSILKILPRPGPWMIGLKQFFGFLVLATVLWLLWVLHSEVLSLSLPLVLCSFFLLALAAWIFGRWCSPLRAWPLRFFGYMLSLLFLGVGTASFLLSFDSRLIPLVEKYMPKYPTISWIPYSECALDMELRKGHTVFIQFSAKWCLTCQANSVVFLSPKVIKAFQKNQIIPLYADWTNGDAEITEMLRSLGRNGVPVYAIFREGQEPVLLPEILTPEILVNALESVKTEETK